MISFAAILLLTSQVMLSHRTGAAPQSTGFSPDQLAGIWRWWVAGDLAQGVPSTNWIDRQSGQSMTNTVSPPTNTASGLQFFGSQSLSANPKFSWGNTNSLAADCATIFVFQPTNITSNFAFMTADNCCPNGGLALNAGVYVFRGDLAFFNGFSSYAANVINEIAITAKYKSDGSAATNSYYTNGVLFVTHENAPIGEGQGAGFVNAFGLKSGAATTVPFQGYIREILWYSNSLSASDITTIHGYLTNKYGYSP